MYRQTHPGEPTEESRLAFEGRLFDVRVDTVRLASGRRTTREIVLVHGHSVSVVPVDEDGNVYLVRQYRKPLELVLLEVVAGGIDEGETAEEAAHRELREEAGLRAERLELLSFFWMSPGFCTEGMHAYLATGIEFGRECAGGGRKHRGCASEAGGGDGAYCVGRTSGLQEHCVVDAGVGEGVGGGVL